MQRVSTTSKNVGLTLSTLDVKDTRYTMCLSIIHVSACHLLIPRHSYSSYGLGLRIIEGDFLVQEFERLLGCLGVVYKKSSFVFDLSASHIQFHTYIERRTEDEDVNAQGMSLLSCSYYSQGSGLTSRPFMWLTGIRVGSSSATNTPVKNSSRFAMSVASPRSVAAASNTRLSLSADKQSKLVVPARNVTNRGLQYPFTITRPSVSSSIPRWTSIQH